jgi:hypothetical protein
MARNGWSRWAKCAAIGTPEDRAIVLGSSLGGLTAARVAEQDARMCAHVLLAPAFRLVERWRARIGAAEWEAWRTTGYLETKDHAHGGMARVGFGFTEDVARVEARGSGWPDVRVPTLIIHGTGDDIVPVEGSRRWATGKQHVHLVEVDDGHELVASLDSSCARPISTWRASFSAEDSHSAGRPFVR